MAFIKADIDARLADKKTLEEAGFWSGGMWVASIIDPLNVAFAIPVWGQLGLMARGGMTVGQAAAASARGGLATGLVAESFRAPFDKTNTFTETGLNLAATTAVSTIFGSAPSVARQAISSARTSAAKRNEIYKNKGSLPEKIGRFNIKREVVDMPDEPSAPAPLERYTRQDLLDAYKALSSIDAENARMRGLANDPAKLRAEAEVLKMPKEQLLKVLQADLKRLVPKQRQAQAKAERIANQMDIAKVYDQSVADYQAAVAKRKPVMRKGSDIFIDEELLEASFKQRSWTQPEVPGATPFKEKDFLTPQEWGDFLVAREIVRSETKQKKGRPTASSKAAYADLTNKKAYERMASEFDLAPTPFNRSAAYKVLTTPGKRIMLNGTPSMKRDYHLLAGVDQYRMAGVESGKTQHQSVSRRTLTHRGNAAVLMRQLENLWSQDQLGRNLSTKIFGYSTDNLAARLKGKQSFENWFETIIETKLMNSAGRFDLTSISKPNQEAVRVVDRWFKTYQADMQDLNMLNSPDKIIERRDAARAAGKDKLADFLDDLIQLGFVDRYQWPIYYNKALLLRDENARLGLEREFADHIRNHPVKKVYNDATRRFEEVASTKSPEDIARDAVASILEEGEPTTFLNLSEGAPKGKHLRHRMIDIPEWKIAKYIHKDPKVIFSYATRVGRRMEYVRNFGDRSIDDILDGHEAEMRAAGFTEKKIQSLRQDFLFDYERVMGEYIRSADRADAQIGKAMKSIAGMTYLDTAALASVTDLGNIAFERGIGGKAFMGFRSEIDRGLMAQTKKSLMRTGEAQELSGNIVQQRLISDNIEGIDPNLQERIFSPIERAYYNVPVLGNGLGSLTYYFKTVDGVYRSDQFMDIMINMANGTAKEADAQYLFRHGLSEDDAKIIASYPHEKGDRYIFANRENWPASTPEERALNQRFDTALNIGMGNTILHATTFDKPRIMDGVVYVRHRPWMNRIGLEVDERASTASIKVTRLETQAMTFPFQFFNFMLGATNRITAGLFDPMKQNRMIGTMALIGLGYTSLKLKKLGQPWWFEQRSNAEIMQRTIDASGVFGVFSEVAYVGTHAAIGLGMIDADESLLRPKYNPSVGDVMLEPFGAAPGMIAAWIAGATAYFNGDETEAAKQFEYNTPTTPLIGFIRDWFE